MNALAALVFEQEPANLAEFCRILRQMGFPHRVSEAQGQITVWVFQEEHMLWLRQQYALFEQGMLVETPKRASVGKTWMLLKFLPVTSLFAALSVLGFLAVFFNAIDLLSWLSFQGFNTSSGQITLNNTAVFWQLMKEGQWWRLFTPMFLHFSWLHIGFNLVIFIFFAKQIERLKGHGFLFALVMILAFVANVAEYSFDTTVLFGGLSGVVYGLIAYCSVINFRLRKMFYFCPPGLFYLSIIMIVLGFLDFFSLFGLRLGNWAHAAGFITACLIALLSRLPKSAKN